MRNAGPRIVCSPAFTFAVSAVALVMTLKYLALNSSHVELQQRLAIVQNQLKLTANNMREIDTSMRKKEEELKECIEEKSSALRNVAHLETANKDMGQSIISLKDQVADLRKEEEEGQECLEQIDSLKEQNDALTRANEDCKKNDAVVADLKSRIASLEDELAQKQAGGHVPALEFSNASLANTMASESTGESGIIGRNLPILPRGNPNQPNLKPQVAVGNPVEPQAVKDERYRQDVIRQQENYASSNGGLDKRSFSAIPTTKPNLEPLVTIGEPQDVQDGQKIIQAEENGFGNNKDDSLLQKDTATPMLGADDVTVASPARIVNANSNMEFVGKWTDDNENGRRAAISPPTMANVAENARKQFP